MQEARWTWSPWKDEQNRRKHGLPFEIAQEVFLDPLHLTDIDPHEHEERWRTYGRIRDVMVIVVHTEPQIIGEGILEGRIISARKADAIERKRVMEAIHGKF